MLKKEEDFIENLNSVRRINTSFVIASAIIKTARNGKDYLEFSLTDKTGEITARMFPNRDANDIFENRHCSGAGNMIFRLQKHCRANKRIHY